MNKKSAQRIKKSILKCLSEEFTYGKTKKGTPLKRPRINQALFDKKEGFPNYNGIDLEMIMDKVVLGIWFCLEEENNGEL